jgi:hypothetical protein
MASDKLPLFIDIALKENQRRLSRVFGEQVGLKEVLALCQGFRLAGIGALFVGGTSDVFLWRLHQSGRCFAHFLLRVAEAEKLTSRSLPFFDAIAARDLDAAREIACHSRRDPDPDMEYAEDFLFAEFLMQCFFLGATEDTCHELLARHEQVLQGAEDFRLDVCRALLVRDEASFGWALARFLAARNDALQLLSESGYIDEELLATEGQLSVEGLALVHLAEQQGLATEQDYLHVPSIARERPARGFLRDSWRSI